MNKTDVYMYSVITYLRDYFDGPRLVVFVLTVALLLAIRNILIERAKMPVIIKKKIDKEKIVSVFGYIKYSFQTINKERLDYHSWKQYQKREIFDADKINKNDPV